MALSVTGDQIESILRKLLPQRGYKLLNKPRTQGETGADIIAKKNNEVVFIECIGYQENPPLRSKQFYEGFFRTVSRLKDGATRCVLALPAEFNKGRKPRYKQYGEAWTRIGNAFPELEIWPVSVKENTYYECKWNDWPVVSLGSAISSSHDKQTSETSQYTEEFDLKDCSVNVKDICDKLKNTFLSIKSIIKFKRTNIYTGVVDKKRIAYVQPKKEKVRLRLLLAESEVRGIIRSKHHKVVSHSKSTQRYWGGKNPNCAVDIYDTDCWDEIQGLLTHLVEKHQET